MQPWQLFSTRLGIAAMLISPVIVASSVEAINTLVKQLALRADFDFQTRVYSRSGLSEALKRQTLPADKLLTVMVLDIDGFKRVNDALGHEGGDCVLTQFAQQVRQLVGEQGWWPVSAEKSLRWPPSSTAPSRAICWRKDPSRGGVAAFRPGPEPDPPDHQSGTGDARGRPRPHHRAV